MSNETTSRRDFLKLAGTAACAGRERRCAGVEGQIQSGASQGTGLSNSLGEVWRKLEKVLENAWRIIHYSLSLKLPD